MKKLFISLLTIMAMVSCSESGDIDDNGGDSGGGQTSQATLTVSPTNVDFATEGGEQGVAITSTAAWTASLVNDRADDWCSIDSTSGSAGTSTLTITATANDTPDDRTASVVVKSGTLSKTINVSQKQKDAIVVANDTYTVDGAGGTIEIAVGHNVDFDVVISADWITSRTTRAYETETMVFAIAENPNEESREGTITFISADGTLKQVVKVKQGALVSAEIEVELTSSSYINTLHAQVAETFGSNVTLITHKSDNTYIITLKKGYSRIPDSAFWDKYVYSGKNTWLKSITIGNGIIAIGEKSFYNCDKLESITIPDSVTSIGDCAFIKCSNLSAFYGKNASADNRCLIVDGILNSFAPAGLTSYTIPDSVTSIGDCAFEDCDALESITIPDSVTSIGDYAFEDCVALESITIPDSVTSIGDRTFGYCDALESITIPDSVTSIGVHAFLRCVALESITIPDSVTSIGDRTFGYCDALESITIPDSVTSIGVHAFLRCVALESITIPDSVTSIGDYAFQSCYALKTAYCKPIIPPTLGSGVFYLLDTDKGRDYSIITIYVHGESLADYQSNDDWSVYNLKGYYF